MNKIITAPQWTRARFFSGVGSIAGGSLLASCAGSSLPHKSTPDGPTLEALLRKNHLTKVVYQGVTYMADGSVLMPQTPSPIAHSPIQPAFQQVVASGDWNPIGASCVADPNPPTQGSNWLLCTDGNGQTMEIQQIGQSQVGTDDSGYVQAGQSGGGGGGGPFGMGTLAGPSYYGNSIPPSCDFPSAIGDATDGANFIMDHQGYYTPALVNAAQGFLNDLAADPTDDSLAWEFMVLLFAYLGPADFLILIGGILETFYGWYGVLRCFQDAP